MVDNVMQRIVEIIYSIPEMLIILLLSATLKPALEQFQNSGDGVFQKLVTLLGPNLISMFIAFGLLYWVTMSRIIRGQILQLKQQEYVTAARALGAKGGRIISKHLLPNCYHNIPADSVSNLPGIFLIFSGCGCICTADQSGIHVFRSTERTENLSVPTVHPGSDPECYDPVPESVW